MATTPVTEEKLTQTKEISEEQLISKELDEFAAVAREMLSETPSVEIKKILSNPSAVALSTTKHDAGEGIERVKKTARQLFSLYLTNQFFIR